uniref:Uncharacterized protein n=1 Tax=Salix viminalis TaxID=40686 RepID=A0A6N2M3Q7_SALVM
MAQTVSFLIRCQKITVTNEIPLDGIWIGWLWSRIGYAISLFDSTGSMDEFLYNYIDKTSESIF